jgi:hypothetical protein
MNRLEGAGRGLVHRRATHYILAVEGRWTEAPGKAGGRLAPLPTAHSHFGHFSPGVPDSLHIAAYPCASAARHLHAEQAQSPTNSLLVTDF